MHQEKAHVSFLILFFYTHTNFCLSLHDRDETHGQAVKMARHIWGENVKLSEITEANCKQLFLNKSLS